MTTRHSPTPWRLDHERVLDTNNDVVALIADRDGNVIDWPWVYGDDMPDGYAEAENNAAMMTAAPALLAALEAMHNWLCEHWGDGPINGDDLSLVDVGIAAEIAIQEARGN